MTAYIILGVAATLALIFFFLLLFAVAPNQRRNTARFCGKFFAHRGLHDGTPEAPENSMEAFRRAMDCGYGVELDVQFTRDKKPVVFHDQTLERMCGTPKVVSALSYKQLQKYTLLGGRERIPLLIDVLRLLGDTPVVLEIKAYGGIRNNDLCRSVMAGINQYAGDVCVESFSPFILQWFKRHKPGLARGQLSFRMEDRSVGVSRLYRFLMRHLLINCISRPDFIAYKHTDKSFGLSCCRRCFRPLLIGWTYRSSEEISNSPKYFKSYIFEGFLPTEDLKDA